jgi:organic radical activating enzyme
MELEDIVERVLSFNCQRVIFTGGEPAMQDLHTIGTALKEHDIHLSIETNGTIQIPGVIDWICVSPKDQLYPNVSIKQRVGDELKVVYCGQDLSMYDELKTGFEHHYLQPCYLEEEIDASCHGPLGWNGFHRPIVEIARRRFQTHKWMGVD